MHSTRCADQRHKLTVMLAVITAFFAAGLSESRAEEVETLSTYLVQSVCLDTGNNITRRLPFDADCGASRPMTEDDPVLWRKHDWGGSEGPTTGWQISDAVSAQRDGMAFVDQTFDFGAPATDNSGRPDAFRRFDGNDGGDAIVASGDTASVFLTQDGGTPGLQWFVGENCERPGRDRYISWVLFKTDVGPDWHSLVAALRDRPNDICPRKFSQAFTRYKRVTDTYPVRRIDPNGSETRRMVTLPTILSEHYDRPTIDASGSMERFYYAARLGKVRWEAWSADAGKSAQAATLARSGRCPPLADSAPPGSGWMMVDCRMWTNIVIEPDASVWHVRDFNWPPADLKLQPAR